MSKGLRTIPPRRSPFRARREAGGAVWRRDPCPDQRLRKTPPVVVAKTEAGTG